MHLEFDGFNILNKSWDRDMFTTVYIIFNMYVTRVVGSPTLTDSFVPLASNCPDDFAYITFPSSFSQVWGYIFGMQRQSVLSFCMWSLEGHTHIEQ